MAEGKCASCAKYLLIGFNFVFWVAGILFLGAGIWIVATSESSEAVTELLHIKVNIDTLNSVGYASIAIGSFMVFIGFCGCCGAIRESVLMLGVYTVFMVILLMGEVAGIIYIALEKSALEAMVSNQLYADVRNYTRNDSAIDFIQQKFGCCGVENYTDYFIHDVKDTNWYVPDSCCVAAPEITPVVPADRDQCQYEAQTQDTSGKNLHTLGCFTILKGLIDDNGEILIGLMVGIILLEIIGVVFAVFLWRNRTDYDYYDD